MRVNPIRLNGNIMQWRAARAMEIIGMHTTAVVSRGEEMYCQSYGYKCCYFVRTLHYVLSVQNCMHGEQQVGLTPNCEV
jgi:hypothetical protein